MKTLFIDTHSSKMTMAIITDKEIYKVQKESNRSHSEIAVPSLEEVLKKANCELKEMSQIIVVNGPGSFTGVRIGVTIAKTIAYSLQVPIKTITSLETKVVSAPNEFDLVTISDSKGFYSALKKGNTYTNFAYFKEKEFKEYVETNNYTICPDTEFDFEKIINYLKDKEYTNPHQANPIYIKEIDALK